jgi:hypothetical protein
MITRYTTEDLARIQQRMAAQSKVYTHNMKDEPLHPIPPALKIAQPPRNKRGPDKKPRRPRFRKFMLAERTVLRDCSELLDRHPFIAFWYRANVGAMNVNGRYIKFSFRGCSDLIACSVRGRFVAVEVKATGKHATDEQQSFLDNVNAAGGLGVCVDHAGKLELALREL